jgi:Tfp pilus assembly protein PilE
MMMMMVVVVVVMVMVVVVTEGKYIKQAKSEQVRKFPQEIPHLRDHFANVQCYSYCSSHSQEPSKRPKLNRYFPFKLLLLCQFATHREHNVHCTDKSHICTHTSTKRCSSYNQINCSFHVVLVTLFSYQAA